MASDCAYKPKNPLPFRRLKAYGNGIWDESRKAFYPFKSAVDTVTGKKGIYYYVRSYCARGANTGDHAASFVGFTITSWTGLSAWLS